METSIFNQEWQRAEKSIFRLEAIPEYTVPEDLINFNKWKAGKFEVEKESQKWLENIKAAKNNGLTIQRVRVVTLPLTEYLKYEIAFWKSSSRTGEEILFLKRDDFNKIINELKIAPEDFWLFDDKVLIIFHYNKDGDFQKEELIDNQKTINQYSVLKEKLLKKSFAMKKIFNK